MIITRTPLRVSLLGGNTDFPMYFKKYGGRVLSTAIDKYIYCIVKKRFDDKIYLNYSIKEKVDKPDELKHELVKEALKLTKVDKGVEITFLSDIPSEGSGLGSSSSVTVGVLNALYNYQGIQVTQAQLSADACKIEIDILKKPIGVQDQIIAAYGGFRYMKLDKDSIIEKLEDESLEDLERNLILFYTNITRSADKVLSKMILDKKILDQNKILAQKGYQAIKQKDTRQIGTLLHDYWQLKKKLNKSTTNGRIDKMYKMALTAGADGGKILGAGGGGFLLVYTMPEKQQQVREALKDFKEMKFGFEKEGSKVIFNV